MIRFSFLLFNLSGMGRLRKIDFREIGSREKSIRDTHKLVSPSEFSSRVSLADRRNHGEISDPSIERERRVSTAGRHLVIYGITILFSFFCTRL